MGNGSEVRQIAAVGVGFGDRSPAAARDVRKLLARALVAIAGWPRAGGGANPR